MTEKLALKSMDITEEKKKALKQHFPEVFSEGKIDFERLKQVLGEAVDSGRERYGLMWAGKGEALKNVQIPSIGTLRPVPEESVNFDTTENLIIEGDNLEVLKLLQKSYYGKVKMIYIDPPYNTGNEFIYTDNYQEGLEDYLRFTSQIDENGVKLTTNTELSGRHHSRWLNMMYPRLFLARNLLKEDGLIFVSIDDHEVENLKLIMNEIFGEENHIVTLIWHRRQNPDSRNTDKASTDHEYILVYGRSEKSRLKGREIDKSKYKNPDNDPRGPWASIDLSGLATKEERPNLHFDIVDPKTGIVYPPNPSRGWSKSKEVIQKMIENDEILFPKSPTGRPRQKKFLKDLKNDTTSFSSVLKDVGYTTDGTREMTQIMGEKIFSFPKPTKLIKTLVNQALEKDDLVLDFFAGSGTVAQSVLELNQEDQLNRRFILVQLPEPTGNPDYPTIADIAKERVRRVIKAIEQDDGLCISQQDLGFKVFKLDSSNFKIWEGKIEDPSKLEEQLEMFANNIKEDRSEEDLLYEIVLKAGYMLTEKIETVTVGGTKVYSVKGGELLVCLSKKLDNETIEGIMDLEPKQVICLDLAFMGNDQLKTNTALQMKSKGIKFRTV